MTIKHHPAASGTTAYRSPRLTTVYFSRSVAKTSLTIAALVVALLLIVLLG